MPWVAEANTSRWLIQREAADPENLVGYEAAARRYVESIAPELSVEIHALRGEGTFFIYLATAPAASIPTLRRLSRERASQMAQSGLAVPETQREWVMDEMPELSRSGDASGPVSYFHLTFHYIWPGSEDNAFQISRRLTELRTERGARFSTFRAERESGQQIYVVAEGASDRASFLDREQRRAERRSDEERHLLSELGKQLNKIEKLGGVTRQELSTSGREELARAIWASGEAPQPPVVGGVDAAAPGPVAGAAGPNGNHRPESSGVAPMEPLIREVEPGAVSGARLEEETNGVVPLEPLPRSVPGIVPAPPLELPDPEADAAAEAAALARDWAAAWSEQRVGDYLSFYSDGFRPPVELSRSQWDALRKERLEAPAFIRVTLDLVDVDVVDSGRARVEFRQSYTSDAYSDVVTKRLELVREDAGWRIAVESVITDR